MTDDATEAMMAKSGDRPDPRADPPPYLSWIPMANAVGGASRRFLLATIVLFSFNPGPPLHAQERRPVDPPVLDLLEPSGTLSVDHTVVDTLKPTDFLLPLGHRVAAWRIQTPSLATYQLDLRSTDFDPYIYVLGGTRSPLLEPDLDPYGLADDDGGDDFDAHLCFSVRDTVASVVVVGRNRGLGRYSLSLARHDCEMSPVSELDTLMQAATDDLATLPIPSARHLNIGDEIAATLGEDDPILTDRHVQSWLLYKTAGQPLSIMVDSEDFDPYLAVLAPEAQLIFDDDGGVGTNARLDLATHTNGEYRIFVTSWSSDATGSFRLRVSRRASSR